MFAIMGDVAIRIEGVAVVACFGELMGRFALIIQVLVTRLRIINKAGISQRIVLISVIVSHLPTVNGGID
jgi:hypothetical protein